MANEQMNPTLKAAHDLFCQEPDPGRPRKGEHWIEWADRRRWELFVEGERLKRGELIDGE